MLLEEHSFDADGDLEGIKIAQVVSNEDPKGQERVLVRVAGVHNLDNTDIENSVWAHHCSPFRSASGDLPEPDDLLWVMFPNVKDPMMIIWLGFVVSSYQDGLDGTPVTGTGDSVLTTSPEELTGQVVL